MASSWGQYSAVVDIRPGTVTAGSNIVLWTLMNGAVGYLQLRKFELLGSYNQTTSLAASWYYGCTRFTAASPTGGNLVTPFKFRTTQPTSTVSQCRQIAAGSTSGLTNTGAVYEGHIWTLTGPRHVGAPVRLQIDYTHSESLEIGPNEGLAILLPVTNAATGDYLTGYIQWDERQ